MVGQTISHYEILEQLGSGGMGVVYKARDTKLDRILALKFLPAKLARDEDAKQRFMQEAKAASSLDDPHICTIYEIGEADDGQLFIAMAYYDGSTLQDLIEKRQIKIEDAASIARQMAKGLSTAHEAGIVHRDVKPANVMVTRKGLVKLLDFGVAKLGQSSDLTREGSTIGTASYMSPEQARGESVDARSDVWSIGAVLYEMLTGARPFGGGYEAAVAYSIINEDPPPIAPARPDAPEGLIDVVGTALSKKAELRFPTARALADALAEYAGETIVETAPQTAYRPAAARDADVPSVQKLVVRFAIGGGLALAGVYAAMIGLGLPDWVFPTAVLLTLMGLPITLYAANVEKQRARMDSGERAKLAGLKAKLSTKLALRGGMIAAGVLVLAIIGYSGLRAAGIGPFASLISSGVLQDDDFIIVTDFANKTDTPDLGATVARALRIDLSQSTAITVMDEGRIHAALVRMGLSPDTLVTAGLAIDIAMREGVKAIVEGEVSKVGSGFQLSAAVLAAGNRTEVFAVRESARDDSDILAAIDRLSAKLREEIGESLISIRSNPPLEQVSTASLDALRHYSKAEELDKLGRDDEALAEIELAIAADSLFGMAHRKLAVILTNLRIRYPDAQKARQKAFDLRDRMTERERLLTEGTFWAEGPDNSPDPEKAKAAYRNVLEKWPNDLTALNNLANELGYSEEESREALDLYQRALAIQEGESFRQNLLSRQMWLGDLEGFRQSATVMRTLYPNNRIVFRLRMDYAFSMDSLDAALDWLERHDSVLVNDANEFTNPDPALEASILFARGQIDQARKRYEDFAQGPDMMRMLRLMNPERSSVMTDTLRAWRDLFPDFRASQIILELTGDRTLYDEVRREQVKWFPEDPIRSPEDYLDDEGKVSWTAVQKIERSWRFDADLQAAKNVVVEVDSLIQSGHSFVSTSLERDYAAQKAYVLGMLAEDPSPHVTALREAIDRENTRFHKDMEGRMWDQAGRTDNAIDAYTRFVTGFDTGAFNYDEGMVAPVHFRLGELYEEKGDLDMAIHHYQKMVDRWKDADAILQPQVEEARRRIDQLVAQKAQEPR